MVNILISLVKDAAIDYNSTLLFLFMFFLLINLISLSFSTFGLEICQFRLLRVFPLALGKACNPKGEV